MAAMKFLVVSEISLWRKWPLSASLFILDSSPLRRVSWRPRGMGRIYWRTLKPYAQIQYGWVHYGDFPVFRKDLRQVLHSDYHEAAQIERYFNLGNAALSATGQVLTRTW